MLCPVYGHELTPLSCPPHQGVSFRSFKGLIILSPYNADEILQFYAENRAKAAFCATENFCRALRMSGKILPKETTKFITGERREKASMVSKD